MWSALLLHQGCWLGTSAYFDGQGKLQSETQTTVTLTPSPDQQTIRQENQYFDTQGQLSQTKAWEYSSLSRSVLFFDNGAFSQGSTQFGPYGDFGAEFGLIAGEGIGKPRRLRGIPLYRNGQLETITFIREYRQDSPQIELPALTPGQLTGIWQGIATTLYPDFRNPTQVQTQLEITFDGQHLHQSLHYGQERINSTGAWNGEHLTFFGPNPIKLFCFPGGGSVVLPLQIPTRQGFFLELAWLVNPQFRLRLSRHYDSAGAWQCLTLVEETKII
ncbi:DUF3598 family protein [Synechococcus sp. PCC 6312]|uniref:DUF3598 family protein n=1 Tax=Synechococcus sp. (strain ATCC 27167 / PCC 6312) TaxID=195253 RepID=UPI00029F1D70|nr:DUF3598 family protein [Synechococcus sp. PCC 6312]AFY62555.1 protein of unknown function (DUF3598) [Synechococcus sp. PCC 6312]